ncbi:retrovirus-related pol polyprotein from transposon TNT 1-94 [Tanacetum coccineum]
MMDHQFELMANVPNTPHNSPLLGGYIPGSDEGRLKLQDLSKQVLDLKKKKDAQAVEILRLNKRVKGLKRQRNSSTSQLRRRKYRQVESSDDDLKEEDASKQGRSIHTLFMDGTPMEINMLVEKKYPLIKELLEKMLNLQLEAKEESTMAFDSSNLYASVLGYHHQTQGIILFKIDNKKFSVNFKVFKDILNICPRIQGQEFDVPPTKEEDVSFIRKLGHSREIKYITDVIVDHLHQPWRTFASTINKCLYGKDLAYQIDNIYSKKQEKMFYPRFTKIIIHHFLEKDKSISIRNRTFMHTARDDSLLGTMRFISRHADTQSYGAIIPKAMTNQALLDSIAYRTYYAIASKKSAKVKKVTAAKPKPTKKKAPVKADRGKGLNVLSEIALSKATQLKEATKRSKKDFHISQASGSGDGTNFESGGDSGEEDDDDENDSEDESDDGNDDDDGNDGNDGNGEDDDDANDDDNQEDDDTNNNDEETDNDRTESDRIKIPVLNQPSTEYYEEEEEEKIDDEETMDEEEDDEVTKELYHDVNMNLGNRDTDMTDVDQGGADQQNVSQESGFEQVEEDAHVTLIPVLDIQKTDEPVQSSSVSSDFTSKLLNLKNPSLVDNEIASLMDTIVHHEEPRSQTSYLYTVPVGATPEVTSFFTITIPPPPLFFNPLPKQATPTPTPTTSEATTSFPSLLDFSFIFKFKDRVTNLEKDLLEIKQVDEYAQALSSIPAIVDRYIDNKLGEAIQKAVMAHNLDCREEAQAEKRDYIEFVDTSIRAILKEEKNVTESLEAVVLARFCSQPKSTYEEAASLSEFELTKILIDKMEKNKRKSSKEAESSRDSRSKEKKSLSTSKDASHYQHKPSGKSAHAKNPSHTVDDLGVQHDQEFDMGNSDEQPADKEVTKAD